MTRVVNIHRGEAYDVYIGRPSKWGNPFHIGPKCHSRGVAIAKFREYLRENPGLVLAAREELQGRVLGCHCKPLACHGDVLVEAAEGRFE